MEFLREKSRIIRKNILEMIYNAGSGHPGGSLSTVEILVALYFQILNHDPGNPKMPSRDRFILSKGHAAPALYATLAECGYFSSDILNTLRKFGSILQGHPTKDVPGVEFSSGSLGMGLSFGNGMAISRNIDKHNYRIYVLLGDGECDEGQVWEAAMFAAHHNLDCVTAIIDRNGLQIDGPTERIIRLEPFADKWRSFGWEIIEIDGNNIKMVIEGLEKAKSIRGKPTALIAHTFKGKGVSFMEWMNTFHGRPLTNLEMERAFREIDESDTVSFN